VHHFHTGTQCARSASLRDGGSTLGDRTAGQYDRYYSARIHAVSKEVV
ncbi:uncharacterized protein METZ01_LOCUS200607, partial [marine metagenome]